MKSCVNKDQSRQKLQPETEISKLFSFPSSSASFPEPPSLSIHPSALPLMIPGQVVTVQCEASGFAPLSLELSWEFRGADGQSRSLGSGSVTGHRQAWDGTYSQSTRLELDPTSLSLGRGGEVTCVAVHPGGTRQASVTLDVIGNVAARGRWFQRGIKSHLLIHSQLTHYLFVFCFS